MDYRGAIAPGVMHGRASIFRYQHDEGKAELIKQLTVKDGGIMSAEKVLNRVSRTDQLIP
jgi:hypothetical protein